MNYLCVSDITFPGVAQAVVTGSAVGLTTVPALDIFLTRTLNSALPPLVDFHQRLLSAEFSSHFHAHRFFCLVRVFDIRRKMNEK